MMHYQSILIIRNSHSIFNGGVQKDKQLSDKKMEKQYQFTQQKINTEGGMKKGDELKYSIISRQQPNTFFVKNLDENKIQFVESEKHAEHIIQNVQQIPRHQALIESLWQKYLNEYEKQQQQFLEACYQGRTNTIKQVLRSQNPHPIDPRKTLTIQGKNGIHLATLSGSYKNIAIIELLAGYKVDINGKTAFQGRTPLMLAAIIGNQLACQALLTLEADTTIQDKEGNTALHFAYHFNRQNIVYMLLDNKAPTDIKNSEGKLPEQCSIRQRYHQNRESSPERSMKTTDLETSSRNLPLNYQQQKVKISIAKRGSNRNSNKEISQNFQITHQVKISESAGLQDFKKKTLLGRGAFGQVFLVQSAKDGQQYAMKRLDKSMVMRQNILRYAMTERKILSTINHPFIIKLHYAFQNNDSLFLIMDYCEGGDLLNLIKKKGTIPEEQLRLYITEIILALDELHKAQIIYRDLKPGNVVIRKNGHVCLTDFGLSKQAQLTNSFCGSTAYLAPEMLWRRGHTKVLDWYLLGVLIYQCLTGKPPFWNSNKEQLLANIRSGRYKALSSQFSPEMIDFVAKLLTTNSRKRLGAKGAEQVKKHKWFEKVNWDNVYKMKQIMPQVDSIRGRPIKSDIFQSIIDQENLIEGWEFQKKNQ